MDQQAREQAFMNALATEHFVLQAARSAIVGEQVGRGSIYLGAVSSAPIALGFLAQVVTRLDPFVAAVLPALFLLGEFTPPEADVRIRRQWPPSGYGRRQRRRCSPGPASSLPSTASWVAPAWPCWLAGSVTWVMESADGRGGRRRAAVRTAPALPAATGRAPQTSAIGSHAQWRSHASVPPAEQGPLPVGDQAGRSPGSR
jgi:hypothetical protein